ncbi:MAG: S8 family serine peptidase [Solirubrobacteraceae bacterium]|nr:S8 family serine peptidase [Solirubrobacteraceae bacterium]
MRSRQLAVGAAALALLAFAPVAQGAGSSTTIRDGVEARPGELLVHPRGGSLQRVVLRKGVDPGQVARELQARPDLFVSASENLIASAAANDAQAAQGTTPGLPAPQVLAGMTTEPTALQGWVPNDAIGGVPWTALQWNFAGTWGVKAPQAWQQLRARGAGRAGGNRVKIAVIDSGISYRTTGPYRESPDLPRTRILQGYDFVDEDRYPDDRSGHGTHVASTIAGATNNASGLTGLAYEADIIPVRVLDEDDEGDTLAIARGIKYAVRRGAHLINLSADFPSSVRAEEVPEVMAAVEEAHRKGVLVISSSGNDGVGQVSLPARSASVLSVGATTARGCRAVFSNAGSALDLVAPGGGADHASDPSPRCQPNDSGVPIAQVTLVQPGDPSTLGVPLDYVGTSMAAAHVTGIAALVHGSRLLGTNPSPDLLAAYLVRATRDLGPKGRDSRFGDGLIDAQKATDPRRASAAVRGAKRAVARASVARSRGLPVR